MPENWKPIGDIANKAAREIERERLWRKCVKAFDEGNFEIAESYHDMMVRMIEAPK